MNRILATILFFFFLTITGKGQDYALIDPANNVTVPVGGEISTPLKLYNASDLPVSYEVEIVSKQIGVTQVSKLCYNNECFENVDKLPFAVIVPPGETLEGLEAVLTGGQAERYSTIVYRFREKDNPQRYFDHEVAYTVEEKARELLYSSQDMAVGTVYPNPVTEVAMIDYSIKDESRDVKIVIHNVLGSKVEEISLKPFETQLKFYTTEYNPGVYFYTLYIDNDGMTTKKMIVRN